jgi:PAS domain S-box-containing protein
LDNDKLKILLIEDDEDDYVITRDLLHEIKDADIHLEWVDTYDAGLEALRANRHDVCLVDYRLGEPSGLALLHEAVSLGCKVPIIMLTGQGDRKVDIEAMKAGAADYLDKSEIKSHLLERSIRYAMERKRLQEALYEERETFFSTFRKAPCGIALIDKDGRYLYTNIEFTNITGYSLEDVPTGKDWFKKAYPDPGYRRRVIDTWEKDKARKNVDRVFSIVRKDGKVKEIEFRSTWIDPGRAIVILSDITERKQAEKQIENLTRQLLKAQENERQLISRYLHDTVAQNLSTLKIQSETLLDKHEKKPSDMMQRFSNFSRILQETILMVRDISYDLLPPILEQLGLVKAAFQHCEDFYKKTGIKVDFSSAGLEDVRLDFDVSINLYRILQEALNNIQRHANATHVTIRLIAAFPNIILRIIDDGKGFDMAHQLSVARNEKRMGLRSMKERVSLLGGDIKIKSFPDKGTKILIEVPYKIKSNSAKRNIQG